MKNLLQKLGLKKEGKSLLKATTLTNSNLVALNREYNLLPLIKKSYFSYIQKKFLGINHLDPKIYPKCIGNIVGYRNNMARSFPKKI